MIDPSKKVFSLLDEFKKFALKGNVIDLAVAVVVGAAFGKLVDSLVKNLIMPLVSSVLPVDQTGQGYLDWSFTINGVTIPYGHFLGDVVNFLIIAAAMFFFMVKFLGFILRSKKEEAPPPPTKEQQLLTEIRDLLRSDLDSRNQPRPQAAE